MLNLAPYIDHTALKPETSVAMVENLCDEAMKYKFASVCINPIFVKPVAQILQGSGVKVCTVVGFPLGANLSQVKYFETEKVIEFGAQEVDMVINIGAAKNGNWDFVSHEIGTIAKICRNSGVLLKVIFETCLFEKNEIVKLCEIAVENGADFVKTSTGFAKSGADVETVALMKKTVADRAQVKASGGIRSYDDAVAMIEAGATRLGTSAGILLLKSTKQEYNSY